MHKTKNRKLILDALTDAYDLPVSARYLHDQMDSPPSIPQVSRTLRDLWVNGDIIASRYKVEPVRGGLPYWEVLFEPSEGATERYRHDRLSNLRSSITTALGLEAHMCAGMNKGLTAEKRKALIAEAHRLLPECADELVILLSDDIPEV